MAIMCISYVINTKIFAKKLVVTIFIYRALIKKVTHFINELLCKMNQIF